ncbi:hypothetical protein ANBU17_11200 [Anaerostipes butyraticus]|uniref:Uncharacterized protein n=1 Tax=Anaerostipes butyraticus TaxID=645466 RepID=A0A916VD43_9FIRM|nr:hypothetical protein ANBU17_11200 [Anaerostipes butyraticus]
MRFSYNAPLSPVPENNINDLNSLLYPFILLSYFIIWALETKGKFIAFVYTLCYNYGKKNQNQFGGIKYGSEEFP